jgi:hypothetical protein
MSCRSPALWALATISIVLVASSAPGQDLADLYKIRERVSQSHVEYHSTVIAAGKEIVLGDFSGPGKITYFYITDDTKGRFYPGLVLRVFWDDEAEPSINVPLADFFGAVNGRTIDYQSAPMQINHLCYMCYLPMPFMRKARFVLANDGDREYHQNMAWGIDYERGAEFATENSRLHACWKRSNPTRDSLHTVLEAKGRGHYIGGFLQVHSRFDGWWGEGDTIFHIDGKAVTHSPGTEDEYGSCWMFGHTYSYLYSGYILMEKTDHRMYRWYVANPVRFQDSLRVEIQNQRWQDGQIKSQDDYTSVAFWYQEEPHVAETHKLQTYAERTAPSQASEYTK